MLLFHEHKAARALPWFVLSSLVSSTTREEARVSANMPESFDRARKSDPFSMRTPINSIYLTNDETRHVLLFLRRIIERWFSFTGEGKKRSEINADIYIYIYVVVV